MFATMLPGAKANVSNEKLLQGLLARAKGEAVPKVTRADVEDDTEVDEDVDVLVKSTSDFQSLRGEEPMLQERNARFCVGRNAELSLGSLMFSFLVWPMRVLIHIVLHTQTMSRTSLEC